jgi:endonuclease-3
MAATAPLRTVIRKLERHYGAPARAFPTEPFQQIVWENVAYLADDRRRREAFNTLKREVGVTPEAILHAPVARVRAATSLGILADRFTGKLRDAARIALDDFDGDLKPVLDLPLARARRALRRFPGIGEPGADKILLFSGRHALLAPDSNALRVLQRLGLAPQARSYSVAYAAARAVASKSLGTDTSVMLRAHQLLRQHGQETCTRTTPECLRCPLATRCRRIGVTA